MQTLYPATAVAGPTLSPGAASLLRWLTRWHAETGEVKPSTGYLARKNRCSERTIYRRLAELTKYRLVVKQVSPGVERLIAPCPDAPTPKIRKIRRCPAGQTRVSMSGVVSGVVSGVPFLNARTQGTTTTQKKQVAASPTGNFDCEKVMPPACLENLPAVAAALVALGVTPPVALALLSEAGEGECQKQIQCLPYRKATDASAVLVASIRGRWAVPAALARENDRRARETRRKAAAEARRISSQNAAAARSALLERIKALPGAVRESLEARALALWHQEQPASANLMQGRRGSAEVIQQYVLRLFESEEVESGS